MCLHSLSGDRTMSKTDKQTDHLSHPLAMNMLVIQCGNELIVMPSLSILLLLCVSDEILPDPRMQVDPLDICGPASSSAAAAAPMSMRAQLAPLDAYLSATLAASRARQAALTSSSAAGQSSHIMSASAAAAYDPITMLPLKRKLQEKEKNLWAQRES